MRQTALCACLLLGAGLAGAAPDSGTLIDRASGVPIGRSIEGLLTDSSIGTVAAARLAGVDSESMGVVENVRDFSMYLNALDRNNKSFGLAITPARTTAPVPKIDLFDYAKDGAWGLRLLGALTLSYAQGRSDEGGVSYDRRAYAVETSAFWNKEHDPVVAAARATECGKAALEVLGGGDDDRPTITAADASASQPAAARAARPVGPDLQKKANEAYNTCLDAVLEPLNAKWNRSRYNLSYVSGSIKPSDGTGDSVSLGRTVGFGLIYGFDGIEALGLQDRAAVTVTVRRSMGEPVLDTLGSNALVTKNSTLVALRLSGGSEIFRGLFEASNARDSEITTTQRTFVRALGVDYRVAKGLWLNLRYGTQRKSDGNGDEIGSFLMLNYSPSAMLGH